MDKKNKCIMKIYYQEFNLELETQITNILNEKNIKIIDSYYYSKNKRRDIIAGNFKNLEDLNFCLGFIKKILLDWFEKTKNMDHLDKKFKPSIKVFYNSNSQSKEIKCL
tara:strand:+ start:57 stop:383 length:327 start_codon:yes stop_codon:yes gene_type:complete